MTFTRIQAYECNRPKVKSPQNTFIEHSTIPKVTVDPLVSDYIPTEEILTQWKYELERNALIAGYHYYSCSIGRYSLTEINTAMQMHKIKAVSRYVEQ